jgi:hypothetical protein
MKVAAVLFCKLSVWRIFFSTATLSRMFRRRIYTGLIVLSLLSLSSCTLWSQPKRNSWKNATGAEQHERLLWQAIKDKDWLNVESHLASNFVYMGGAGTRDKQQRVKQLRELQISDFSIGDLNVTAHGPDAVVTYTLTLKTPSRANEQPVRIMSVWQQVKRGWVLVAMSETAVSGAASQ